MQVVGSTANNNVALLTGVPVSLGNLIGGGTGSFTLRYVVPEGLPSFRSTVYATAQDGCGNSYNYPAPYV